MIFGFNKSIFINFYNNWRVKEIKKLDNVVARPHAAATNRMEQEETVEEQPASRNSSKQTTNGVVARDKNNNHTTTMKNGNGSDDMNDTMETLRAKISWAKSELAASNSTTYCIELCQLIKAACEAIACVEKL